MSFPFFIAKRFFLGIGADKKSASNPTITIATVSVAVGLAVMIIAVSVIMGFKREVQAKVSGFASDIEVLDVNSQVVPEGFPITADKQFVDGVHKWPGVERVDKVAQKIGVLKTDDEFKDIVLKGVAQGYDTTFIASSMIKGHLPQLKTQVDTFGTKGSNEIALSRKQADALRLNVGDDVFAYFFEQTIRQRRFKVCGIYETNLAIFDDRMVITDISTVQDLNSWNDDQCSILEVRLAPKADHAQAMAIATEYCRANPDTMPTPRIALSIKDHYKQIFTWLDLLDFNMYVILILMLCVASFTMISGLLILILERTQTIGVLKALGAPNSKIRAIFIDFAALIAVRGLVFGNILALAIILAQQHFKLIHLNPATYYVDTVPVDLNWQIIVLLNIGTLVLTTLALVGPSYMISRIQPAKAIRYE